MRIDDGSPGTGRPAAIQRAGAGSSRKGQPRFSTNGHSDAVSLSRLSQALNGPPAEVQKIESLREAVTNGSYRVDSADLSRNIVSFYLEPQDR